MTRITTSQIAAIHATAKAAGLDEEARRALMQSITGKRSSKDLTKDEATRVFKRLKELAPQPVTRRRPSQTMDGRWAGVLRALWLSAWNLGITRSKDDAALIAFIERQTGISHPKFLLDPADARKAIEGLKQWMTRVAGVDWAYVRDVPVRDDDGNVLGVTKVPDPKRAVIYAQRRMLTAAFEQEPVYPAPGDKATDDDLDDLIAGNGEQIRAAQALAEAPRSPRRKALRA